MLFSAVVTEPTFELQLSQCFLFFTCPSKRPLSSPVDQHKETVALDSYLSVLHLHTVFWFFCFSDVGLTKFCVYYSNCTEGIVY